MDWIADYYENIERYPVLSMVKPGEIRSGLPASPPQTGKGFDSFLKDMSDKILPGVTHCNRPTSSPPFMWHATADSILEKLSRLCQRISGTEH